MNHLIDLYLHYMEIGGVTMYPLMLCCFGMWWGLFYYLPCWQPSLDTEVQAITSAFENQRIGGRRHDKQLYLYLLNTTEDRLRRGISTIKILVTIAPLLGLFGTVTGMINTFQSVALYGLANPKALAGGISEAMVTTQFGLLVAVPGIIAVYFLHRNVQRKIVKIEQLTVLVSQEASR